MLSSSQAVCVKSQEKMFYKPATMAEASSFKAEHSDCLIISGGTDLGVQVNKGVREIRTVLSTSALTELRELRVDHNQILAGANLSIAELESVAEEALPEYAAMISRFGSPQIKNAATLGGNIANGSPIGDTLPVLFILNADIELSGIRSSRWVNINDFYTGYKKTVASDDELISRIRIPRLAHGEVLKVFKISKRRDLDISTFSAAIWMKLSGRNVEDVRIAFGGVGPKITRLPRTEAHLKGQAISIDVFDSAGTMAVAEISPISDVRGSVEYRNKLAANIFRKLYYSLIADQKQTTNT
jgi:xanthine dehydrogenase small subunit